MHALYSARFLVLCLVVVCCSVGSAQDILDLSDGSIMEEPTTGMEGESHILSQDLPAPPELVVSRCDRAPVIDGDLNDPCWRNAAVITNFYVCPGADGSSDAQSVHITCDDDWLYLAFDVELHGSGTTDPVVPADEVRSNATDSIDIYLNPNIDGDPCYRYELDKNGVRSERFVKWNSEFELNGTWCSAAKISEAVWQAEVAVPLLSMVDKGRLGRVTMNICITRELPGGKSGNGDAGAGQEQVCWSAVNESPCEPDRFGVLRGLEVLRPGTSLSPMKVYSRRSYYTFEEEAQVVCEVNLPDRELKSAALTLKDTSGKTTAELNGLHHLNFLSVPIGVLSAGRHRVTVELHDGSGNNLGCREASVVKRVPKPGCEWKVDRSDRVILNNGVPFFPLGIIMSKNTTMAQEEMIKDIVGMGFNTIARFGYDSFDSIDDLFEMAKKYGFYVVEYPKLWKYEIPEDKADLFRINSSVAADWQINNILVPGIEQLKNHPNLMSWLLLDEPGDDRANATFGLWYHGKVNEIDGYHPTMINYIPPVPEGAVFSRNCDILGIDPYWVPGTPTGDINNPHRVGKHTWLVRRRGDMDLKPAWIVLCAEKYSRTRMRIFTRNEQRVQTYLALIHGAKGLFYFAYPFLHQSTCDTFVSLGRELEELIPACLAPEPDVEVHYAPIDLDMQGESLPVVQVGLKEKPSGGYILLAANWKLYPVDMACRMSFPGAPLRVARLCGGEGEFSLKDGTLLDTLGPMDARAYSVEADGDSVSVIRIDVELTGHPDGKDMTLAGIAVPQGGTLGMKNLLPNPGFENCTIFGIPDYYHDLRTRWIEAGYRIGDSRIDCGAGIDTNRPYEGKNCLRLKGEPESMSSILFFPAPEVQQPTPFVFSAWVRGDGSPNAHVNFYGPGSGRRTFPLSNEWQRISRVVTIAPDMPGERYLLGFYTKSEVWIDAMQFERGMELSDYDPLARVSVSTNEEEWRSYDPERCGFIDLSELADGSTVEGSSEWMDIARKGIPECGGIRFNVDRNALMEVDWAATELEGHIALDLSELSKPMPFAVEAGTSLDMSRVYSLLFLHRFSGVRSGTEIGKYIIVYEDETKAEIPLIEGVNVPSTGGSMETPEVKSIGDGYSVLRWSNPEPGKKVRSIRISVADPDVEIGIAGITTRPVGRSGE